MKHFNTILVLMMLAVQTTFAISKDTLQATKIVTDELGHYSIEVPAQSFVQPMAKEGNNMIMINYLKGDFPFGLLVSEQLMTVFD